MKDKLSKIRSVFKKYGFFGAIGKVFKYIGSKFNGKFNIFNGISVFVKKRKYKREIDKILLLNNYDRIIVWRSSFGWNVPLFQRPQHISNNLSEQNCLVFYEVTRMTDRVKTIKRVKNNLYLVNFANKAYAKLLEHEIDSISKPKYLQFYSTDWTLSINDVKKFCKRGYKVIYEYIDDLNPKLAGTKNLPVNVKSKYDYVIENKDIYVIVTADELEKDVISKRGKEKLGFSCNGVDYDFFRKIDKKYSFEKSYLDIFSNGKKTIGYYGALASWFDYSLLKEIDDTNKYNIVLFGIKYDDSFEKFGLDRCNNIYYMGSKDYKVLKNYASKIDVLTIPFLINEITKSTSPVKLFEYMALHKPIVTTNMHECTKYKSVLIGKNHKDFISKLDKASKLSNDKEYIKLLDKEAKENDWSKKAKVIIDLIKKDE